MYPVEVAVCAMAGTAREACPRGWDGVKDGDGPFAAFG